MSDVKVPEDLREWYADLKDCGNQRADCSRIMRVIERIARLEAENARLKASIADERVLSRLMGLEDGAQAYNTDAFEALEQERDALKAQVERLNEALCDPTLEERLKFRIDNHSSHGLERLTDHFLYTFLASRRARAAKPASKKEGQC